MLNPYERWIYFHRFILDSSPSHAPQINLNECIDELKKLVDSGGAFKMVENDEACFRIRDLRVNEENNSAVFLLMYSNSKASDPVFSKLTTTDLRPEPKLDGEGIAVSAHAVLSLSPTENGGNEFLFLLEEVPGLGRSGLEGFFQTMFRAVTKGRLHFDDEEENGRSRAYRPRVRILATPSKTFQEELEGSTVDSIELVERIKISHFDEEHYYKEDVRTLKLKVVDGNGEKPTFIEKLRKKARSEGFDDLKIRYKKNGGKRKTAVMGTDTDDVKDALVGRVEYIEHAPGLSQCSDKIVSSYAAKILGLLE
ncbi:hypothetical protein [uncultured Marinobacter sp.]|uniref:hypothetical protein n=1 Tax=uncultured Marinobacter sp. TaxID=187379 RepID=UPI002610BCBD|nr:hypothetical protein [uncultured Marinobacter sp.]